jgi:hypothetical protein
MATQPVQQVQQVVPQPYQRALGSPYCYDPTCKSCQELRDEYDHLSQINFPNIRGSDSTTRLVPHHSK